MKETLNQHIYSLSHIYTHFHFLMLTCSNKRGQEMESLKILLNGEQETKKKTFFFWFNNNILKVVGKAERRIFSI